MARTRSAPVNGFSSTASLAEVVAAAVAGDEQDRQIRLCNPQAPRQFGSLGAWHGDIGQQQIQLFDRVAEHDGGLGVCGFDDIVAPAAQIADGDLANLVVVLYHHDCCRALFLGLIGLIRRDMLFSISVTDARGSMISTVVPAPTWLSIRRQPPDRMAKA